jgi:hypothetical protein
MAPTSNPRSRFGLRRRQSSQISVVGRASASSTPGRREAKRVGEDVRRVVRISTLERENIEEARRTGACASATSLRKHRHAGVRSLYPTH